VTLTANGVTRRPSGHDPRAAGAQDPALQASHPSAAATPGGGTRGAKRPSADPSGSTHVSHPASRAPAPTASPAPGGSPSPTPNPAPSASPSPTASAQLAASINVYGPQQHNAAQVTFQVNDTGNAATGQITASITLPSGASLLWGGGHHGHGGWGGWQCQPTSTGASCQHAAISAGAQAQGVIFIAINGSSACGQPVQVTASSGAASASAQSPQDIQCSNG
jgi:hypothetical protein